MRVEPDTILFGIKGSDDWGFAPDVIARLDESQGYLILEEEDQDIDPAEDAEDWPVMPGNQIIWIQDNMEDEAEPLAIVSADKAGDQFVLEEVAREWARGADNVEVEVVDSEVQVIYSTEDVEE